MKTAKELSTKSAIKLQALEEESQVYKERCKTLESVQEQQHVEKELTKEIKREKKKLELGQVELEKEIKQLEQAQDDLVKSLEDARKKIVSTGTLRTVEEANLKTNSPPSSSLSTGYSRTTDRISRKR